MTAAPPANGLDVDADVVAVAGGGGAGATFCAFSGCVTNLTLNGGSGGVAMSNAGGEQRQAAPGENGGGAGNAGVGGAAKDRGQGGGNGVGGLGGGVAGQTPATTWRNAPAISQSLTDGAGGSRGCEQGACYFGGGGGGWGGGASGSPIADDQGGFPVVTGSAGGGGGSFAAPSAAEDPNAPTTAVPRPSDGRADPRRDRPSLVPVDVL